MDRREAGGVAREDAAVAMRCAGYVYELDSWVLDGIWGDDGLEGILRYMGEKRREP